MEIFDFRFLMTYSTPKRICYVILLFPLIVMSIIYVVSSVIINHLIKNTKSKFREIKRKWNKRRSIHKYNLALKSNKFTITSKFIEVAEDLQHLAIHNEHLGYFEGWYKCTEMIVCLNKLSLPNLSFLCVRRCRNVGKGDRSYLYISKDGSNDYSIWNHITVEDSHMGAWHVYLLNSIWHSLPLFWHGLYDKRTYIYSENDIEHIEFINKDIEHIEFISKEIPKAAMGIRDCNIIPEIVKNGSKYYVSCCYWNNWTGLNRELVEITIDNNIVKEIAVIETYNLIKYHCWILF